MHAQEQPETGTKPLLYAVSGGFMYTSLPRTKKATREPKNRQSDRRKLKRIKAAFNGTTSPIKHQPHQN